MASKMAKHLTVLVRAQIAARYEVRNTVIFCAEMVACGEGKKCHNPSGGNQELSFAASDLEFGYGGTEKWPSIHIPI